MVNQKKKLSPREQEIADHIAAGGQVLDIYDETIRLESEIPAMLGIEFSVMITTPREEIDENEANKLLLDFVKAVILDGDKKRFRQLMLRKKPDGSYIGIAEYIEIFGAVCEAYFDFPTEGDSSSSDPSTPVPPAVPDSTANSSSPQGGASTA